VPYFIIRKGEKMTIFHKTDEKQDSTMRVKTQIESVLVGNKAKFVFLKNNYPLAAIVLNTNDNIRFILDPYDVLLCQIYERNIFVNIVDFITALFISLGATSFSECNGLPMEYEEVDGEPAKLYLGGFCDNLAKNDGFYIISHLLATDDKSVKTLKQFIFDNNIAVHMAWTLSKYGIEDEFEKARKNDKSLF
jgi:hypothetical protein